MKLTGLSNQEAELTHLETPDRNPIGPLRVWLKHEDIPGLAMTRSFGDEVAGRVGVIAEPGKNKNLIIIFIEILN